MTGRAAAGPRAWRSAWLLLGLLLGALGLGLLAAVPAAPVSLARVLDQSGVSLTVSPTTASPNGAVTATWSGIANPTSTDWLALYVPGTADNQYLVWRYTTGTASGSLPFQLPASLQGGTYELRLANNSTGRLAMSTPFTVPRLTVSPGTLAPNGILTAAWSDLGNPLPNDFLALYVPGTEDHQYLSWRPGTGSGSGTLGYQLPSTLAPGTYELRLVNNSTGRRAVSNPFTVATLVVSPASNGPGGIVTATWGGLTNPSTADWLGLYPVGAADNQYLRWRYTTGAASGQMGFDLPNDLGPGTYELRLFGNSSGLRLAVSNPFVVPPLTVSPASVAPGGTLTVAWTGIASPSTTDWIGLFTPEMTDTDPPYSWRYTDGSPTGQMGYQLRADLPTGAYEIRLFSNATWQRLAVSNPFTMPTLAVSPSTTTPGSLLTASWNRITNPTSADWIGLFAAGAPDTVAERRNWQYTNGTGSGASGYQLPADLPVGSYQLRLFSNGTWLRLAASAPVTITGPSDPGVACSPRPPVVIQMDSDPQTGRPTGYVHVTASRTTALPGNVLRMIRFGAATNALIDVVGFTGLTSSEPIGLALTPQQLDFHVSAASAIGGTNDGHWMVPFAIQDDCGWWETFIGGGASASLPVATAAPTRTPSPISTPTATATYTRTPTLTATPNPSLTATRTPTRTATPTHPPTPATSVPAQLGSELGYVVADNRADILNWHVLRACPESGIVGLPGM